MEAIAGQNGAAATGAAEAARTGGADPFGFELFRNAIFAIADEMALTVCRTTYSGVLRDNMDFSTALTDGEGRLIAQGLTLPGHLGSVPTAIESVLRHYGDDIHPGDIFVMNDPFDGGMHLPDIFIFKPVFDGADRLAFAATVCHHADVGGRVAGSNASDSTEIYQEGVRIPPLRLYERGARNETLFALLEKNVRLPVKLFGDIRAQLAACHIAERQFLELVAQHGAPATRFYLREIIDYAERLTRAALRQLPDGEASFEDWIDDDGVDRGKPIRLFVTLRKEGDSLHADWAGSSPQVKGAINGTLSWTKAATYTAVRSVLPPGIPNNEGVFRAVTVSAPPGTITNAVLPAACAARGLTGFRMVDCAFGALAMLLPDKVLRRPTAATPGLPSAATTTSADPSSTWISPAAPGVRGPGPTASQGQASGHWTLGNLYLRAPVRSEQIATVSLPSFRAGCGGIDAFAGAFSFIDSDQLVAFARAVAQNAVGFAFEQALETISPVIAETMAKLRALAQWVNSQNLNLCETAQALVGALWSKNDRASAAICAAIGTGQGIFSDYAAAKHGCGAAGQRNSTLASASGAMADQVPVNVNYAWKAIRASSFLAGDTQLAEFAMAVTGTLIVTAPTSDGDNSGPRARILEPLALDRRVTEVLMEGGGQLPVYRCDTANLCLNPTLGTVTIPANRGFRARVAELLRDLVDAVRRDVAPPNAALGLVNLTTLPVYRVANTAAAYRGAVIDQEMDALAEAVALDVMQVWIADLHRTVEERAGTLDIADGEQLQKWREGLRANRVALARHRHQGLQRLNTALAVVEKLRLIETELAGALSADLRAALAFARGGSR